MYSATAAGICCKSFQFLERDLSRLFGQVVLLDLVAQFLGFGGAGFHFAQLALDGADLLAQKEIALVLGHRGDDLVLDFGAELEHFQFAAQQGQQAGQAVLDGGHFQQMLPFLQAEIQVGGDEIGELARLLGVEGGDL